jgi:hypothetical protein
MRIRASRPARVVIALVLASISAGAASSWSFGRALTQSARAAAAPQVGFSFSPLRAESYGDQPTVALESLLTALSPDIVRLPVFWKDVQPQPGGFDYSDLDQLLDVVARHNAQDPARPTRVVLVVGARNIGFPEVFLPDWLPASERDPVAKAVADPAYGAYVRRTVQRYAHNRLLQAWQVENEALDNVLTPAGVAVNIPAEDLQEDVALIHQLDPAHPAVITTYNNSTLSLDIDQMSAPRARKVDESGATPVGHPQPTLHLADILGIDAYVAIGSTSLADASVARRVAWKATTLQYWADEARLVGKPMWITEMQGEVWPDKTNFTPADLVNSAHEYRNVGAAVVLLWGAEGWLHSSDWMQAGIQAREVLGS